MISYFYINVGKQTAPENYLKELGLGTVVTKLLCATASRNGCNAICSDRFLTSVKCAEYELKNNIYQTGTVMKTQLSLELLCW
jgi:hypothetical protein